MAEKITPEDALELMEDEGFVYVDVRSVEEFEGGHPEGAYNIPWKLRGPTGLVENPEFVRVFEATFSKDANVILGCQAGGRSAAAAAALEKRGFTAIRDQLAGWGGKKDSYGGTLEAGWQATGLPTELVAEEGRNYVDLTK